MAETPMQGPDPEALERAAQGKPPRLRHPGESDAAYRVAMGWDRKNEEIANTAPKQAEESHSGRPYSKCGIDKPLHMLPEHLRERARLCNYQGMTDAARLYERWASEVEAARASLPAPEPKKLWLWKNFVDGRPEYWAFDNPYPTRLDCGDPQTLGQPCGYALFKPSRDGSHGRTEEQVLREMASVALRARPAEPTPSVDVVRQCLTALKELANTFHQGRAIALSPNSEGYVASALSAAESAIDAARAALEKP